MNIWFTSDTHYNHKNIVRGCSQWKTFEEGSSHQQTRNFDTLEAHNQKLVENINKNVKTNDTLWHLGDWSFGGIGSIWEFRRQIRCKNIHLVFGNHDHHIENNKDAIVTVDERELLHKLDITEEVMKRYQGKSFVPMKNLFNSTQYVFNGHIGSQTFFLSHYAHRVWPKSHHGVVHLYGHSHGTLPDYSAVKGHPTKESEKFRCMDVGVDTHPEFRPYHIDEIRSIMNKRVPPIVDHHNEKTN